MTKFEIFKDPETKRIKVRTGSKRKEPRIKVGISSEGKGIEIKTKDPEIVLENAEKCFKSEDFEGAFLKLGFVKDENIEERATELLNGNDEEKKLAEEMYQNNEWREKAKKDWFNSSIIDKRNKEKEE